MKWNWLILICLLAAVLAVGCAPAKAPPTAQVSAEYRSIRMPGGSVGGAATTAVMAVTAVLNKYYPEIEWSSSSGSSGTTAIYITKGSVKIGHTNAGSYIDAYSFDKIRESRLRSLTAHQPPLQYFFVIPEDKPWRDLSDVPRSATVCSGAAGTTEQWAYEAWLNLIGLNKKDFNSIAMGKSEMTDAWRTGKLDAALISPGGVAPYLMDMAASPRKFKPLGLSPEQATKARSEKTFERIGFEPPAMSIVTQLVPEIFKEDVVCPQAQMLLASREDFPEDIAYKIAKVLDEHRAELVQIWSVWKHISAQSHIKAGRPPLDIHSGVARYYKEKGYLK